MQTCVIVDYGSGNLRSAAKALERAANDLALNLTVRVSGIAADVSRADRIVLPGVGAFADCRRGLDSIPGLIETLNRRVHRDGVPFLGICVGMQLLADRGLEYEISPGLGWIGGDVVAIDEGGVAATPEIRVPHMGWNELDLRAPDHPLLAGLRSGDHAYFVHSYRFAADDPEEVLATTEYGRTIAAVVGRDNIAGTQFHPEKSQATGLRLIGNFLRWKP